MKPGIYRGMPFEHYLGIEALSNSGMRLLAKSPAHYYGWKLAPDRPPEPDRGGQLEGTAMHCALFEPREWSNRYALGPSVNKATKAWKDFVAAEEQGMRRTCINQSQLDAAISQASSIRRKLFEDPATDMLLQGGDSELTGVWADPTTGVLCKFRADHVNGAIMLDAKTYSDASDREFSKQVARKGYYRQAAWYSEGYYQLTGEKIRAFIFAAVETEYPYVASLFTLDEEALAIGRAECAELLRIYAECMATGNWPGYAHGVQSLSLPSYMTQNPNEIEISYA